MPDNPAAAARAADDAPPPFLGSWNRIYVAVLIYLACLIAVFYVFTQAYR